MYNILFLAFGVLLGVGSTLLGLYLGRELWLHYTKPIPPSPLPIAEEDPFSPAPDDFWTTSDDQEELDLVRPT